jgi:hypothetical protein
MIPKRGTDAKRMTIDYKKLNGRLQENVASLPLMEETLEHLATIRYKSKMDMRSGYWQVHLSEESREIAAFITPKGRVFRPIVMTFGLANAPPLFQELMNKALNHTSREPQVQKMIQNLEGVMEVHIDDVGLGSQTMEQHIKMLRAFFETCRKFKLRIKLEKCEFIKEVVEFLGFEIGWGWWRPLKDKTEAITQLKVATQKDLRRFLGMCNFLRRHIKGFVHMNN